MKTRKSTLELTPLLDVMLIILFVFMMLLANQVNESTQVKEDAKESVAKVQDDMDIALSDLSDTEGELEQLKEDYNELLDSHNMTEEELLAQRQLSDEQQESAEDLAKAIAEFIDSEEYDIKQLLDANDSASSQLLDSMSIDNIAEELLKYEAISRQFYFIDIELKSENNRLFINDSSTSLGLSTEMLGDEEYISDKIDEIKDLVEEDMEDRQGGSQMVFITLKVYDREVQHRAWQAVWDAIGEIQEKYGTEKVFRTQITKVEN